MDDRRRLEKALISLDDSRGRYFCLKRDYRILQQRSSDFSMKVIAGLSRALASPQTTKLLRDLLDQATAFSETLVRQEEHPSESTPSSPETNRKRDPSTPQPLNTSTPQALNPSTLLPLLCAHCIVRVEALFEGKKTLLSSDYKLGQGSVTAHSKQSVFKSLEKEFADTIEHKPKVTPFLPSPISQRSQQRVESFTPQVNAPKFPPLSSQNQVPTAIPSSNPNSDLSPSPSTANLPKLQITSNPSTAQQLNTSTPQPLITSTAQPSTFQSSQSAIPISESNAFFQTQLSITSLPNPLNTSQPSNLIIKSINSLEEVDTPKEKEPFTLSKSYKQEVQTPHFSERIEPLPEPSNIQEDLFRALCSREDLSISQSLAPHHSTSQPLNTSTPQPLNSSSIPSSLLTSLESHKATPEQPGPFGTFATLPLAPSFKKQEGGSRLPKSTELAPRPTLSNRSNAASLILELLGKRKTSQPLSTQPHNPSTAQPVSSRSYHPLTSQPLTSRGKHCSTSHPSTAQPLSSRDPNRPPSKQSSQRSNPSIEMNKEQSPLSSTQTDPPRLTKTKSSSSKANLSSDMTKR